MKLIFERGAEGRGLSLLPACDVPEACLPEAREIPLHLPQVSYAAEITKEGDTITVKRMLEDGYMTIKVKTPCLITCIKELNAPRYMSVGGIFECYEKPYEVFDYNTLKDDPLIDSTTIGLKGSPTNIFKSFTPPQKGAGMMLEGADKDTCDKLAGILAAKHLI